MKLCKNWLITRSCSKIGILRLHVQMRFRCWPKSRKLSFKWNPWVSPRSSKAGISMLDLRRLWRLGISLSASPSVETKKNRNYSLASISWPPWCRNCTKSGWSTTSQARSISRRVVKKQQMLQQDPRTPAAAWSICDAWQMTARWSVTKTDQILTKVKVHNLTHRLRSMRWAWVISSRWRAGAREPMRSSKWSIHHCRFRSSRPRKTHQSTIKVFSQVLILPTWPRRTNLLPFWTLSSKKRVKSTT